MIGGIDLNEQRFESEYSKHYLDKWTDFQEKNKPYYLNALANKQHDKYNEMVHGVKAQEENRQNNMR